MNFDFFVDLSEEEITILNNNFGKILSQDITESKKRIIQNIVSKKEMVRNYSDEEDDGICTVYYLITLNNEEFNVKDIKIFEKIRINTQLCLEIGFGGIIFSCNLIDDNNKTKCYEIFKHYPKYQFKHPQNDSYDKYNHTFFSKYIIINEEKNNQTILYILSSIPLIWSFSNINARESTFFSDLFWFFNSVLLILAILLAKKSIKEAFFLTSTYFLSLSLYFLSFVRNKQNFEIFIIMSVIFFILSLIFLMEVYKRYIFEQNTAQESNENDFEKDYPLFVLIKETDIFE